MVTTTGGGPGRATETLNFYAYSQGFTFLDIGYASAVSWIIVVVLGALAAGYLGPDGTGSPVTAGRTAPPRRPSRSRSARVFHVLLVLAIVFFVVFPIFWLALTAFRPERDVFSTSLLFEPTLDNFANVLGGSRDLIGPTVNSILVAVATTVVSVPLALLAAYGFSRYRFPGAKTMLLAIVMTQFIPGVAIALPFLTMFRSVGLLDTHVALVISNLAIVVPYNTWDPQGFRRRAAHRSRGGRPARRREPTHPALAGHRATRRTGYLRRGHLPRSCCPGTNSSFQPSSHARMHSPCRWPLMTLDNDQGIEWGNMAAAGLLVMVPMLALATLVRKHFAQGMTLGAVK